MANTFKFGNGNWASKKEAVLAYNDENSNFKPLPFTFDRGSSATVVNKQGLIETVGTDEPRIDFTNNSKGYLLLEPSRQNVVTYSEDLTEWTTTSLSVTSNNVLSPDGTQNADKVTATANFARIQYTYTLSASTTYNISFYVKNIDAVNPRVQVYDNDNSTNLLNTYYGSELTGEWKRLTYSFTTTTGTSILVRPIRDINDTEEMYLWGIQVEAGSYATSYIPTQGSAVTRSAETGVDCLLPNETIIDNSTATVYFEFEALADDASNRWISFEEVGTATDNQFEIRLAAGSDLLQIVTRSSGGGQDVVMTETLTDITANNKIALNYNGLNWKLAVNGTITDTATAARLFNDNIEKIKFSRYTNTNHFYGKVKDLKVYNTALTDAELIQLTS